MRDDQPAKPGVYRVVLNADGVEHTRIVRIEPDPRTGTRGSTVNKAEELRRLMNERP